MEKVPPKRSLQRKFLLVDRCYIDERHVSDWIRIITLLLDSAITAAVFRRYKDILSMLFSANFLSIESDGGIMISEFQQLDVMPRFQLTDDEELIIRGDEERLRKLREKLLEKITKEAADKARKFLSSKPAHLEWRCHNCDRYFKKDLNDHDVVTKLLVSFEVKEHKGLLCPSCKSRNYFVIDQSGVIVFYHVPPPPWLNNLT